MKSDKQEFSPRSVTKDHEGKIKKEDSMFRKFFDFNQTIKNISFREMQARYDRDRRRSDKFFKVVLWVAVYGMAALVVARLLLSK